MHRSFTKFAHNLELKSHVVLLIAHNDNVLRHNRNSFLILLRDDVTGGCGFESHLRTPLNFFIVGAQESNEYTLLTKLRQ